MKQIMIIDDEENFCYMVKKNLELQPEKFHVIICNEATWALKMIREKHPDLILMDIMMPQKSGIDLTADIKADPATKNIPIVFLTALAKKHEIEKHDQFLGSSFWISKPASTAEIVDVVTKALLKTPPRQL